MPSYTSVLPPTGTDVLVHFNHGVFNTIVLEAAEYRSYIPVSMLDTTVHLTQARLNLDGIRTGNIGLERHYSTAAFHIPVIKAKINNNGTLARSRTSYRSPTLDAALRGQGRASILLETMPNTMRRNPEAVVTSRHDDSPGPLNTRTQVEGIFNEDDSVFQWIAGSGLCRMRAQSGRVMESNQITIPSNLMIRFQHPQFLIHRP